MFVAMQNNRFQPSLSKPACLEEMQNTYRLGIAALPNTDVTGRNTPALPAGAVKMEETFWANVLREEWRRHRLSVPTEESAEPCYPLSHRVGCSEPTNSAN